LKEQCTKLGLIDVLCCGTLLNTVL